MPFPVSIGELQGMGPRARFLGPTFRVVLRDPMRSSSNAGFLSQRFGEEAWQIYLHTKLESEQGRIQNLTRGGRLLRSPTSLC